MVHPLLMLPPLKHKFFTIIFSLFENIDRIAHPDYIPSNQDILQIRVPTTGVVSLSFKTNGIDFL